MATKMDIWWTIIRNNNSLKVPGWISFARKIWESNSLRSKMSTRLWDLFSTLPMWSKQAWIPNSLINILRITDIRSSNTRTPTSKKTSLNGNLIHYIMGTTLNFGKGPLKFHLNLNPIQIPNLNNSIKPRQMISKNWSMSGGPNHWKPSICGEWKSRRSKK